jgi:HSP20 family molecular chaperone IbpA
VKKEKTMSDNTAMTKKTGSAAVQGQGQGQGQKVPQQALMPAVDIVENETGITLLADMPGVSKERLNIRVDGENLTIEGSAEVQVPDQIELLHSEMRTPLFRRTFTLSRELDSGKIEASLRDGVLRMHIPKAEEARPRRIEVNVR